MLEENSKWRQHIGLLGLVTIIMSAAMSQVAIAEDTEDSTNATDKPVEDGNIDEPENKVIFPGTKWCGTGNIASGPDDLGLYYITDSCCRDHDNCPDYISGLQSKYGLRNRNPSSRLTCECDEQFLACLKNAGSLLAHTIRRLYFNVQTQCFKFEYPIVGCNSFYRSTLRCNDYILDTTAPKKYQWFDLVMN